MRQLGSPEREERQDSAVLASGPGGIFHVGVKDIAKRAHQATERRDGNPGPEGGAAVCYPSKVASWLKQARLDWDYIRSQIVSKNPDSIHLDRAYTKGEIAKLLEVPNTK